jgi:hypothetical protein
MPQRVPRGMTPKTRWLRCDRCGAAVMLLLGTSTQALKTSEGLKRLFG